MKKITFSNTGKTGTGNAAFRRCLYLFLLSLAFALPAAAEKSAYIFVVPLAGNVESKNMIGMLERMADVAKKATGLPFGIEIPIYTPGETVIDLVERGFKDGHSDFGYVHPNEYVRYLAGGGDLIQPIFTLEMMGSVNTEVCFYTRKSDGITSVAGLEGKKWGGSTLVGTFVILHEAGVKPPHEKFFSEMIFVPDVNKTNLIDALFAKKIDVFPADTPTVNAMLSSHEKRKEITRLKCADQYHNWIFVARKGVPENLINTVRKTFLRAHKDKTFQEFWWFLSAVKGRFVNFDPEKLKRTREVVKLEDKYGWTAKDSKFQADNWNKYFKENKIGKKQ